MTELKPEKIKYLIIHHTATSRDKTTFEAVKKYHIEKGWEDIGYHWFINGKGELQKGRDEKWVGAHASALKDGVSMNYQSLGVCLAGNFEIEEPSKEQIATLEAVLSDKRAKFGIARTNVLGHQEIPASTACPGKNLMPFIRTYRARPEQPENRKQVLLDLAESMGQKVEELKKEIQKLP